MTARRLSLSGALLLSLLSACNVTAGRTTGGADLPARGDCPRGIAVVSSDFQSSEIALLTPEGEVKSAAFFSSAASAASNLAAPLSGDVTVAASRVRPNELVLVDRLGTDVLTFIDAKTAQVRAQLPIGTGFDSNPQTYLEVAEHKAYVPRLGENGEPNREPNDAGSDVLIIDPAVPEIVGSLAMPRVSGYRPSPAAIMRVGDDVLVTLQHQRPNNSGMADSELFALSAIDEAVRYRLPLSELQNCGRAELAPDGRTLAVACTSYITRQGAAPNPAGSGIVLLDARRDPPEELQRFAALELVGGPIQSSLAFVSDRVVLFESQTALGAAQDNQLFSLDLQTGRTELLASAAPGADGRGYGIAFGSVICQGACGDWCLMADASRGQILRFRGQGAESDALSPETALEIGGAGLPPTGLTPFW